MRWVECGRKIVYRLRESARGNLAARWTEISFRAAQNSFGIGPAAEMPHCPHCVWGNKRSSSVICASTSRVAAAKDLGAVAVNRRKASALKMSPKKAITTGAVTMSLADNAVSRLAIRATQLKRERRE